MANLDAEFSNQIFRKDYPIILAQNRHLATFGPVRLAYDSGGYNAGQGLARNTVSGLYQKYVSGGASGLGVVAGFLFAPVDVTEFPSATGTAMERAIFGGELFNNLIIGDDGTFATQLSGRKYTDSSGTTIFKF